MKLFKMLKRKKIKFTRILQKWGNIERRCCTQMVRCLNWKSVFGYSYHGDTKAWYDRIVAALQTVSNRRLGVPRRTAIFSARFWRGCEYFVKTRFGISKGLYFSTGTEMMYDIGQGNDAGPAFWLATLIVMFFVLDDLCHGMSFTSPSGNTTHRSTGLGYVDDVTLGTTIQTIRKYRMMK